jgi:hypothetical protein
MQQLLQSVRSTRITQALSNANCSAHSPRTFFSRLAFFAARQGLVVATQAWLRSQATLNIFIPPKNAMVAGLAESPPDFIGAFNCLTFAN